MNKFKTITNVCPYCRKTNLMQAKFCAYCGENIIETQREAYKTTVFGQIGYLIGKKGSVQKYVGYVKEPSKIITSNRIIKIVLIILFFALGLYMRITNKPLWEHLSIVSNDDYNISYNFKEFILDTDKDAVSLKIACINPIKEAIVTNDKENDIVKQNGKESEIRIIKGSKYTLTVTYEDNSTDSINFRFK